MVKGLLVTLLIGAWASTIPLWGESFHKAEVEVGPPLMELVVTYWIIITVVSMVFLFMGEIYRAESNRNVGQAKAGVGEVPQEEGRGHSTQGGGHQAGEEGEGGGRGEFGRRELGAGEAPEEVDKFAELDKLLEGIRT